MDIYFPPVFVFQGEAQEGELPLSFAYAGTEVSAREYWASVALRPGFKSLSLGRCLTYRIQQQLRERFPDCSFVLVEHTPPLVEALSKEPGFRIPFWVNMELPLPNLNQGGWGHQRRDLARRIRKHRLEYELSTDPDHFVDFLENMHLPYILQRYEDAVVLPDSRYLLEVFSRGGLILIRQQGDTLAGCLFEYSGDTIHMRKLGVRGASWDLVREGVIGAIYYFLMLEMEKREIASISLGGTRPLLTDGVTRFKGSLNARLVPRLDAVGPVSLWLRLLQDTSALQFFLESNPFVHFPEPTRPSRAIFIRLRDDQSPDGLPELLRSHECRGLVGTDLFLLGDEGAESLKRQGLPHDRTVSVRSWRELFCR